MADQRGLGEKGFSAALRMIIRAWQEYQLQDLARAHMTTGEIRNVLGKKIKLIFILINNYVIGVNYSALKLLLLYK